MKKMFLMFVLCYFAYTVEASSVGDHVIEKRFALNFVAFIAYDVAAIKCSKFDQSHAMIFGLADELGMHVLGAWNNSLEEFMPFDKFKKYFNSKIRFKYLKDLLALSHSQLLSRLHTLEDRYNNLSVADQDVVLKKIYELLPSIVELLKFIEQKNIFNKVKDYVMSLKEQRPSNFIHEVKRYLFGVTPPDLTNYQLRMFETIIESIWLPFFEMEKVSMQENEPDTKDYSWFPSWLWRKSS